MMDVTTAAESQVLGSMMKSRRAAEECAALLRPEDFQVASNATIYATIIRQLNKGEPTDEIAVADQLILSGDLAQMGGYTQLHEMTATVTTVESATFYAEKVKEAARRVRVHKVAVQVANQAASAENATDADQLALWARDQLDGVLNDIAVDVQPLGWHYDDVIAGLADPPEYRPTPWDDVNVMIDGWRPGALYILAARPGGGKSLMGLMAAAGLAQHGPVAFSSLEMSTREIMLRLIAQKAGINLNALVRHQLDPQQWDRAHQVRKEIMGLPIYVDDRAGVTIHEIRSHVRAVARRGAPSALVVDYLQLVATTGSSKPRWEAVGDISRELKGIAREHNMPVIALAQLSRDGDGKPELRHLRESGSLEQDADVVMLQARERDLDTDEPTDYLDLWVAKNRHGQTGHTQLFWEGHYARITDLSQWRD